MSNELETLRAQLAEANDRIRIEIAKRDQYKYELNKLLEENEAWQSLYDIMNNVVATIADGRGGKKLAQETLLRLRKIVADAAIAAAQGEL